MAKIFGEIDLEGNAKLLEKKGRKLFYKVANLRDLDNNLKNKATFAITDNVIMDRIYQLPNLNKKQLKLAISQKLKKDLEFIIDSSEIEWIYSTFREGNNLKVLVSILNLTNLEKLSNFKALTTTTQVISNFLFLRKKETYLLFHSFFNNYIIFVFRNGIIDYVRPFESESPVDESIELTIEYYKEHHKIDIQKLIFSGDRELPNYTSKDVLPIEEFLEEKISTEFFVASILTRKGNYPFFYRQEVLRKEYISLPITFLILLGSYQLNNELSGLKSRLVSTKLEIKHQKEIQQRLEKKLSKLDNEEKQIKKFFKEPSIEFLIRTRRPLIPEFLKSIKKTLEKSNSFIINITGKDLSYVITIITFCTKANEPKEFQSLISSLSKNSFITSYRIIETNEVNNTTLMSKLIINLRGEKYVK